MLHVVRSELTRLGQRRTLLVWFGLMAVFALMINAVMASVVGQAGAGGLPTPGVAFPTRQELEAPSGVMAGLSAASSMFGVVTLSFWAWFTAQDYSSGLIRLLVAAEPRRWRLLAGKVVALLLITAIATTVAAVANLMAAPMVGASGISTAAWGTDAPSIVVQAWAHTYLSQIVWGVLGLAIAVVSRSAVVAVAIGAGYVLLVESMLKMANGVPSDWLLGSTLNAISSGGTASVSFSAALALGIVYVIVGLALAGVVLTRRDVTD
jgi:ABC-type transport system involved in multi-copper enzyme maturation permease subunit